LEEAAERGFALASLLARCRLAESHSIDLVVVAAVADFHSRVESEQVVVACNHNSGSLDSLLLAEVAEPFDLLFNQSINVSKMYKKDELIQLCKQHKSNVT